MKTLCKFRQSFKSKDLTKAQIAFFDALGRELGGWYSPDLSTAIIWGVDDVKENFIATDVQAKKVLDDVRKHHDANQGVSWEVIAYHAQNNGLIEEGD